MKKGDLRKLELLSAAEEMFCQNGYIQTSVQDIIDRTNSSKGSFYHHFSSKEALLEGICENRAQQILQICLSENTAGMSSVKKLDLLLSGMIPLQGEKLSFLMMLLPVFSLPEGKMIRQYYCEALATKFFEPVCRQIASGRENGEFWCDDAENATNLVLLIVNRLWVGISDLIIKNEHHPAASDYSEYLRLTECCRTCLERFLSIPYGSISLIDLPLLKNLIVQIHNHWAS